MSERVGFQNPQRGIQSTFGFFLTIAGANERTPTLRGKGVLGKNQGNLLSGYDLRTNRKTNKPNWNGLGHARAPQTLEIGS